MIAPNRVLFDSLLSSIPIYHHDYSSLLVGTLCGIKCSHRANRSTFVYPYIRYNRRTSLLRSSLLIQQCSAGLVRRCFMGCCFKGLFKTARSIFVEFSSSFFFLKVQVVQPYSSIGTATALKNSRFISFHMVGNLFITFHTFLMRIQTSLSVDEIFATEVFELVY